MVGCFKGLADTEDKAAGSILLSLERISMQAYAEDKSFQIYQVDGDFEQ
jgi:hypothetical protein